MARQTDRPNEELSTGEEIHTSPASPDNTDERPPESPEGKTGEPETEEVSPASPEAVEDSDAAADDEDESPDPAPTKRPMSRLRLATLVGSVVVVALGGLAGWLGLRAYHSYQTEQQRDLFVQVARQQALNLTTIDWQHADGDVQRILDSATGTFHDDFTARAQPFIDVVKQVQSKSVGTITEAGLESVSGDEAQVLVTVSVKTSLTNMPEPQPRFWRMRISVHTLSEDQAKVSNVSFVP